MNFGILIFLIPVIDAMATITSKNGNGFATGTEVGVGVFGGFLKPLITSNLERLLSSIEVSVPVIESSRKIGIRGIVFLSLLCSSFIFSTSCLNINPFLLSNFTRSSVFSLVTTSVSRIASISCVDWPAGTLKGSTSGDLKSLMGLKSFSITQIRKLHILMTLMDQTQEYYQLIHCQRH